MFERSAAKVEVTAQEYTQKRAAAKNFRQGKYDEQGIGKEASMMSVMSYLLQAPMVGPRMGGFERGGHGGFGFFAGGLLTAVWAAIIVLVVLWIARNWSSPKNPLTKVWKRATTAGAVTSATMQTPLEIVQMRYAKGEINREEYDTMRRDLMGDAPPAPAAPTPATPAPEMPSTETPSAAV
jgi:uncharacterized membrane protein